VHGVILHECGCCSLGCHAEKKPSCFCWLLIYDGLAIAFFKCARGVEIFTTTSKEMAVSDKKAMKKTVLAVVLSLAALTAAASVLVAGVRLEDHLQLAGHSLRLNGAGVRYKAIFKVYAAGLYLDTKASTPQAVFGNTGAKRIQLTMLREIDSKEFGKLFTHGVQSNANKADLSNLLPGLGTMGVIFGETKKLQPGDVLTLDWIPGTGTVISAKGVPQSAPVKEPEFFTALLRIWLGPNPPDDQLKAALLGGS